MTRKSRVALAAFAAAAAVVATAAITASPASASTGASLSLSPSSGSDFSSDASTLSWTLPSACVGNEVDTFLYKGTAAWNASAINTAEGNNGAQATYYNFYDNTDATSATSSTSWPNVSAGYTNFGTQLTPAFTTTAGLAAAEGTGFYTIAIACVNPSTFAPITDSSGNPIAAYTLVDLGVTGNSWAESSATATQIALTGIGTAGSIGIVALKATVTASNGSIPSGSVNFYANSSGTGTPLNGSNPVPLGGDGKAVFIGKSGYPAGDQGAESYTAQFVPASPANFVPVSTTSAVDLIAEAVLMKVTAQQDPATPSSIDVTATAIGAPTNLATLVPGGGVDFIVDGNVITAKNGSLPAPFPFNSNGVASTTITGLAAGTHTVSAQLEDSTNDDLDATVGYAIIANSVSVTTS